MWPFDSFRERSLCGRPFSAAWATKCKNLRRYKQDHNCSLQRFKRSLFIRKRDSRIYNNHARLGHCIALPCIGDYSEATTISFSFNLLYYHSRGASRDDTVASNKGCSTPPSAPWVSKEVRCHLESMQYTSQSAVLFFSTALRHALCRLP